jgi:hypothetical protein
MINYIVAVYGGKRRAYQQTPINTFISKQIEFLSKTPKFISGFTFVINKSSNDDEIISIINNFINESSLKGDLIIRDNKNASYGGWEEAILKTYKDFDYSFLIEDDYLPVDENFIDYFLNKDIENTSFVASLMRNNHASISNGLLNNKVVDLTIEKHGKLFELGDDNGKKTIYLLADQTKFLELIPGTIRDITNEASTIFNNVGKMIVYNDPKLPIIIKPIV